MGYIGIDRGLRDHWIYQDAEYLKVWMEMLFLARFSEDPHSELIDGEIITVKYSEFIYGRIKWSDRLKVSEQRLRTLLKKLKAEGMVEVVSEHRKCTLYRMTNYSKFNQQSNQQNNYIQQGISDYTNQQSDHHLTTSQPADNQQLTTKEESNKVKKVNKVNKVKEHRPEIAELTNHFIFWIIKNNPNAKTPQVLDKWNDEMDKLERIDKYDLMQIRSAIDWCQQDPFWKSNILSVPKLREKISTLVLQMQRKQSSGNGKVSSFTRLQQLAREEHEREASGNY